MWKNTKEKLFKILQSLVTCVRWPEYSLRVSASWMERPWSLRAWTFSFSASSLVCYSTLSSSRISSMDTCCQGVSLSFFKSKLANASLKSLLVSFHLAAGPSAFCHCARWGWQYQAYSSFWAKIRLQCKAAKGWEHAHHHLPPTLVAASGGLGWEPIRGPALLPQLSAARAPLSLFLNVINLYKLFNYINTKSDTLKSWSSGAKGRESYPSCAIIQIEFIKI